MYRKLSSLVLLASLLMSSKPALSSDGSFRRSALLTSALILVAQAACPDDLTALQSQCGSLSACLGQVSQSAYGDNTTDAQYWCSRATHDCYNAQGPCGPSTGGQLSQLNYVDGLYCLQKLKSAPTAAAADLTALNSGSCAAFAGGGASASSTSAAAAQASASPTPTVAGSGSTDGGAGGGTASSSPGAGGVLSATPTPSAASGGGSAGGSGDNNLRGGSADAPVSRDVSLASGVLGIVGGAYAVIRTCVDCALCCKERNRRVGPSD